MQFKHSTSDLKGSPFQKHSDFEIPGKVVCLVLELLPKYGANGDNIE